MVVKIVRDAEYGTDEHYMSCKNLTVKNPVDKDTSKFKLMVLDIESKDDFVSFEVIRDDKVDVYLMSDTGQTIETIYRNR